ncbi:MAG TPA: TonB-dependent receptor [Candidatus Eisenbacteria bacterium]|jgi:outer membrane receptor protein involved in Fe transport
MVVPFLALTLAAAPSDSLGRQPDSSVTLPVGAPLSVPDSTQAASPRVVRRLAEIVVRAQFHDPLSSETVQRVPGEALRKLPVSSVAEALALQAGLVAQGEALHVRGGRSGESAWALEGVSLAEPLRYRLLELPVLAVREVEVVSGGLDAEYGGALAGVVKLRTLNPPEKPEAMLLWQTDGREFTHYDRVSGRLGLPLRPLGVGMVTTLEAALDDAHLPFLRTKRRREILGGSFGWRADNRILGHLKLATLAGPKVSLEVVANRRVEEPFNPMFSLDGWTTTCVGGGGEPPVCLGPGYSPEPLPGYDRYRAADHAVMTDDRKLLAVLAWSAGGPQRLASASLGWLGTRRVTSVGGGDDDSYLSPERLAVFGSDESPYSDLFHVYAGDEPFFHKAESAQWSLRGDLERVTEHGNRAKAGLALTYDAVRFRELDFTTYGANLDSLRSYRAFAPGASAYAQGRWVFEGMVLNGGLRAEYFTPGPQADDQSFAGETSAFWSFSPRLGVAYPISVRDVFSLAYVRMEQNPARDFLYENRGVQKNISARQQLGNPNLEPATVIDWQAAVKHSFSPQWAIQLGFFYRDLFGLVGTRSIEPRPGLPMPRYENVDEGHATGFELSLTRAEGEGSHAELHYTYLQALGTQSLEEGLPYGFRSDTRLPSIGEHPLDWDRRHSITLATWWRWGTWAYAWSTTAGTGLPWTPRTRRQLDSDLSQTNARRFDPFEWTNASARWRVFGDTPITLSVEVHNLFDRRNDARATLSGYPHPYINTIFDDYGAWRSESAQRGGAYWNDDPGDVDDLPGGWVPVDDPRLLMPPRTVRVGIELGW